MVSDAHINMTWGGYNTALHLASARGLEDVVRALLLRKCDPEVRRFCPVHVAPYLTLQ